MDRSQPAGRVELTLGEKALAFELVALLAEVEAPDYSDKSRFNQTRK